MIKLVKTKPAKVSIKVPKGIPAEYRKFYKVIVEHLQATGIWQGVDETLLVNTIKTQKVADDCHDLVQREGVIVETENGPKQNPALQAYNQTAATLQRYYSALGLGAAARRKLANDLPKDTGDNPWTRNA